MDSVKYQEAVKAVNTKKSQENYFVINFSYGNTMVLPYKDGIALLASLEKAELFKESYSEGCKILPMERDAFSVNTMSAEEYRQIKIANLLGVSLSDVKQYQPPA